ncbi:MAG: hypothetical protein R3C56_36535 [Pirellulaceae bacterium]
MVYATVIVVLAFLPVFFDRSGWGLLFARWPLPTHGQFGISGVALTVTPAMSLILLPTFGRANARRMVRWCACLRVSIAECQVSAQFPAAHTSGHRYRSSRYRPHHSAAWRAVDA